METQPIISEFYPDANLVKKYRFRDYQTWLKEGTKRPLGDTNILYPYELVYISEAKSFPERLAIRNVVTGEFYNQYWVVFLQKACSEQDVILMEEGLLDETGTISRRRMH